MQEQPFKNPFQADQEHLEMISLKDEKKPLPSIESHHPTFTQQPKSTNNNSATLSDSSMFDILQPPPSDQDNQNAENNYDDQPPLLEDIGIDPVLIKNRMRAVMTLRSDDKLVRQPDLAGPVLIALALGFILLLGGKIHFSDIEAAFLIGAVLLYFFFNCMNKNAQIITLYMTMSFLGYSLLPMLILATLGILFPLSNGLGVVLGVTISGWSSWSCGGFIAVLVGREESIWLVFYPLLLFYLNFGLIIIF